MFAMKYSFTLIMKYIQVTRIFQNSEKFDAQILKIHWNLRIKQMSVPFSKYLLKENLDLYESLRK